MRVQVIVFIVCDTFCFLNSDERIILCLIVGCIKIESQNSVNAVFIENVERHGHDLFSL